MNKQKGNVLGTVLVVVAIILLALIVIVGMKQQSSSVGGTINPTNIDAYSFSVFGTPVITHAGGVVSASPSAGLGYSTGAGCAVTQATNRSTGVTCTGVSGAITTQATSLAAGAEAEFTVTDTSVAVGDTVVVSLRSGATANTSVPIIAQVTAGSFDIELTNLNAATADTGASILNFAVVKAVSS